MSQIGPPFTVFTEETIAINIYLSVIRLMEEMNKCILSNFYLISQQSLIQLCWYENVPSSDFTNCL